MTPNQIARSLQFGRTVISGDELLAYGAACAERALLEFRKEHFIEEAKEWWFVSDSIPDSAWPKEMK